MFTAQFWKAAFERAVMAAAAALIAVLTANGTDLISDVDWLSAVQVAGLAALVSLLKSMLVAASTDGTPSLGPETLKTKP